MNILEDFLYPAADDVRHRALNPELVAKSPETKLFGPDGTLDSLGLVAFLVSVEQRVAEKLGVSLTLANENAMSQKKSPFRTMRSLAGYIEELLAEDRFDSHDG
jgi:hypothetical protein